MSDKPAMLFASPSAAKLLSRDFTDIRYAMGETTTVYIREDLIPLELRQKIRRQYAPERERMNK